MKSPSEKLYTLFHITFTAHSWRDKLAFIQLVNKNLNTLEHWIGLVTEDNFNCFDSLEFF